MSSRNRTADQIRALYTPTVRRSIRAFSAYMGEQLDGSNKRAARLLECSPTTVSRLRRFVYSADPAPFVDRMRAVLLRHRKVKRCPVLPEVVMLGSTKAVMETLEIAHIERTGAAVLGPTGVGKTVAVERYVRQTPGCLYIVGGADLTKHALAEAVCAAVGVNPRGTSYKLRERAIAALRDTDRMLIVDDADGTPEDALQLLRKITDPRGGAHIGWAIVGTSTFLERLRERRSSSVNQFLGRLTYLEKIHPLGRDDLAALAGSYDLDEAALDTLVQIAGGEARLAAAALVTASRMNGEQLTAQSLLKARSSIMPRIRG